VRAADKPVLADVGFEVAGVDTQGAAEPDGGKLTALNEQVDKGAADVEDLSNFPEIQQASFHVASSASRRQRGGKWGERKGLRDVGVII